MNNLDGLRTTEEVMGTELTHAEQARLDELMLVIRNGKQTFVQVGTALWQIKEEGLYRIAADSFEVFCMMEFDFTRRRAAQLIDAAAIVKQMASEVSSEGGEDGRDHSAGARQTGTNVPLPQSEAEARVLKSVPADQRADVMRKATETAPKGKDGNPKVTAAHLKRVAREAAASLLASATPPVDDVGHRIEKAELVEVFRQQEDFRSFARAISRLKSKYGDLCDTVGGQWARLHRQQFDAEVDNLHAIANSITPYALCPCCGGDKCGTCEHAGWMPEVVYALVPPDVKDDARAALGAPGSDGRGGG